MNNALPVLDATIIGAMTPPDSKAPFNRASVVVKSADGRIIQVRAYTTEGKVEGPSIGEDDWRVLVATEQAVALPGPASLVSGAALWVLRPNLARRERALQDLRAGGVLLHEHLTGSGDAWLCLVDESRDAASSLRDRWCREAVNGGKMLARAGQWPRAQAEAEVAQAVSRGLDPEVLALLVLTYEGCGRDLRAKGILTMAGRSRGEDFARQVRDCLVLLRHELSAPVGAVLAPLRLRPAAAWKRTARDVADRGNTQALQGLSSERTAA